MNYFINYRHAFLLLLLSGLYFTSAAQNPDTSLFTRKPGGNNQGVEKHNSVSNDYFVPKQKKRSEKIYRPDTAHSPQKAVIRSSIIPGWGQIYNHQYLYVPVIYGGLTILVALMRNNNAGYKEFLAIALYRNTPDKVKPTDLYYKEYKLYAGQSNQAIYDEKDAYRRNRDLCILGIAGFWGVNAIQAYVAAKFQHSYSVDDNLSVKVTPDFTNQAVYAQNTLNSYIPGIKITFAIR